ncbi:MAG: hypothetical protein ACOZF0_03910 [Thermodesulfobacteriota bacterium]
MHSIADNLMQIDRSNHLLAEELAKLPELRNLESDATRQALDNLFRMYQLSPDRFDHMLDQMQTVGLPAFREYCSPLQAFFWLLQDEKLEASGKLLGLNVSKTVEPNGRCLPRNLPVPSAGSSDTGFSKNDPAYSLTKILDAAWNGEPGLIISSVIHDIIQRMPPDAGKTEYASRIKRSTDRQLQSHIMDDFLKNKELFDTHDWNIIEKAIRQSRWKQFHTVADRLNSPELVSYYINKYFLFRKTPSSGVYFTFFAKTAQCTDAAYFTQYMLGRAGYKTFMRSVKWDEDPWDGLHTGAGVIQDDGSYLLVSSYTGINSMSGPYTDLESLDRQLSCDKKIIGSKWGAYYPPRYY